MFCRQARVAPLAAIAFVLALAGMVGAQEFRGSITGPVADQSGGVLPGVTVTNKNLDTGVVQTVVTDANGLYQVRSLNPGRYEVPAELQGFYQYQSGAALTWGNVYYDSACGDPIAGLDVSAWSVSCFYLHDALVQTGGVEAPRAAAPGSGSRWGYPAMSASISSSDA